MTITRANTVVSALVQLSMSSSAAEQNSIVNHILVVQQKYITKELNNTVDSTTVQTTQHAQFAQRLRCVNPVYQSSIQTITHNNQVFIYQT